MWALYQDNMPRVQTLLAFHKHLHLNYQSSMELTALMYAVMFNLHAAHSLIQLGVDVNIKTTFKKNAYTMIGSFYPQQDRRILKIMLLLAGLDPVSADSDDVIKNYARKWLSGLEYAKKRFQSIFDSEMLEKTVCEFIFNEEFLRNVL